jgi:PTH1 family peptidyl-tRNA hydrolase
MLVIAGLGNPGAGYGRNRHNIGFEVVGALADRLRADSWRAKFYGEYARCRVRDEDVLLLRPLTYMNESGRSVQAALSFFRVPPDDLVVVHDELDLPFGTLRLKQGGGHAGHNGLRSISQCIGSGSFARLRFGIGKPPQGFAGETANFVLSDFPPDQRAELPDIVTKATDALELIVRRGLAAATKTLNTRPKPQKPEKPARPSTPDATEPASTVDSSHEGVADLHEKR